MQSYLVFLSGPRLEPILVLTGGTMLVVGVAALAAQCVRSAIWQRTIWQVATLGVLALALVELTGTGPAAVRLWRARLETATAEPGATLPAAGQPPLAAGQSVDPERTVAGTTSLRTGEETTGGLSQFSSDENGTVPFAGVAMTDEMARDSEFEDVPRQAIAPEAEPTSVLQGASHEGPTGARPGRVGCVSAQRPLGTWELGVVMPKHDLLPLGPLAGAIWALGAVVIAARMVFARVLLFAFWRRRARLSNGALGERVGRLARRLGIRREVRVLEAAGLSAPVAFGSFRPTVTLPVTFAEDFDRPQQEAVLAHELAHLAAHDPAWNGLASLLCAVLWWHPLVWWLRHRLRGASEAAADEASLLVPGGPDLLADCLVAMGRRLVRRRELGWLSFEGQGFRCGLGRRVERLLKLRRRPWRAPGRGRLLLAKVILPVALVVLAVCCTAWARPQATLTEGGTRMQVIKNSWRNSLAAAALALCGAGCSDAVADDPPIADPSPAVVSEDLSAADGQLALLAEDEEGEAREREDRERREGEAREREGGEARERGQGERREGEGRERREPETDRARLDRQLQELEERAQDIKRALEGLRDGQDAEARELQNALREVKERMSVVRRELGGGERDRERPELGPEARADLEAHVRELTGRRRELLERMQNLKRELQGLRRDDQAEQAGNLRRELQEMLENDLRLLMEVREIAQRLGKRPEGADRERPGPDREQLARRLEELKREIGRLAEAGRHDEAEAREREAREIGQLLERRPDRPGAVPPEDLQRRIHHLKVAIENLHAAGLHDQAEGLVQQLQRLAAGTTLTMGPPEPPRPPEPRERPVPPELIERLEQQGQAIRELSGAVNELRDQTAQLREMLEQLRRPEREERP